MATLVCIRALEPGPFLTVPILGGYSSLDLLDLAIAALAQEHRVVVLTAPGDETRYPDRWQRVALTDSREAPLIDTLIELAHAGQTATSILYHHADEPFLDPTFVTRMIADHHRYVAEYTFADGYPGGLAPEILAPSVLPRLRALAREEPAGREALFTIIQRDINAFDIETLLADDDMRLLRIELNCSSRRNWLLCKRVAEAVVAATDPAGVPPPATRQAPAVPAVETIVSTIRADLGLLRTLPAYVMVDVVEGSPQDVAYSPYRLFGPAGKGKQREMTVDRFASLIARVEDFSPGSVYSIGAWGEPGLHGSIDDLIGAAASVPLVIETSGVGWDSAALEQVLARTQDVTWIVHLDAIDESEYRRVRGDGFLEAMRFTERLFAAAPAKTYVQTVRYTDLESHTEAFYRYWKERTDNIIIQKYDPVCGVLEDKRVTDISPVHRFPCWHLKRDLLVMIDGTVPRCREDIHGNHAAGNIFSDGVEAVWDSLDPVHRAHVRGEYPSICAECDEYYTFNF
ncbi:MAG: spiro-SPASM protein [Spirochaetaceae bacterium]|nr:MAG: spiro-SPASM protein [Spirochaetaceae bacterium]